MDKQAPRIETVLTEEDYATEPGQWVTDAEKKQKPDWYKKVVNAERILIDKWARSHQITDRENRNFVEYRYDYGQQMAKAQSLGYNNLVEERYLDCELS